MKVLTTMRRVPDLDARVHLRSDGEEIDYDGVAHKENYFDEVAVECAVRLREAKVATEVVAVCMGPSEAKINLRKALAMGADRGILVEVEEQDLDPFLVATLLAKIVAQEEPSLVIMGKLGVDFENAQVPQMLAEILGWPSATFAFSVEMQGDRLVVGREVDGGSAYFSMPLPAVVSADLRLNEPRYPNLPGIARAQAKRLDVTSPEELGVEEGRRVKSVRFTLPPERKAGAILESVDDLVIKLRDEAKVL